MKIPKICPICGEELHSDDYFLIPIEVPYCNLFVHKSCVNYLKDVEVSERLITKLCKGEIVLKETIDAKS